MRATWFVMEDGSPGDPNEVAPDKNGVLRNKSGTAVAMKGDVPHTRGVDLDENGKPPGKPAAKVREANSPSDRQMKAESGPAYKTR